MLTLFYSPGSCALASHIALEEAGADYALRRVDFASAEQTKPDYLAINPKARVPSLQTAKGVVTSISPDSFNPLDQQAAATNGAPLPGAPQDLYYKAEISLDVLNLHNVPPGFRLVPGMPLEADMKIGKRTAMGFFLQRMLPIAYNSMHEP